MLIEIPDDLARKVKKQLVDSAVVHRRKAEERERCGLYVDTARHLMLAAILEADLPEPVQVGHLALLDDEFTEVLVIGIDGHKAWIRDVAGWRKQVETRDLTYIGPKPEGWGQ